MKRTIKSIALGLALLFSVSLFAQSEASSIVVTSFVPDQDGLVPAAKKNMENKVSQLITSAGMGSIDNSRFALIPRIVVTEKNMSTATATPMIQMNADITMYFGDVETGKVFGSHTLSVIGIGQNDTKAYISAISNIKPRDPEMKKFLDKCKQNVIDYYTQNADKIIKKALQMASTNDYDGALATLLEIPEDCGAAYDKASAQVANIFQQKINHEGEILYKEAYTLWNATLNYDGAVDACAILAQIHPMSSASGKANTLADQIGKRVREVDQREWNFKLQKQKDQTDLQKALINAAAEVAKAEANRPVYNYNVVWW